MLLPTTTSNNLNQARPVLKKNLNWGRKFTGAACMSCHGPSGAGIPGGGTDIAAYPRLGGQHKSYVIDQMKFYKSGQRANAIMADIAGRMSDAEVNAVANFIQGLH